MSAFGGIPAQYNKKSSGNMPRQRCCSNPKECNLAVFLTSSTSDIFEWHFTLRGPEDTEFEGGLYHGRILLPNNYPFAPPSLMFLTPNGRFELNKKVCLSITGYHPEYWQPAWGIRTVLVAVMGFLPTESKGAIGGLDTSVEARKALAVRSKAWKCQACQQSNVEILLDVAPENAVKASLKTGEMPEFSFGYESDKKNSQATEEQEGQKIPATSAITTAGAAAAAARALATGSSSSSLTSLGAAEPTDSRAESATDNAPAKVSTSHQETPSCSSSPVLKSPSVGKEKTTAAVTTALHTIRATTTTTTSSSPTAAVPAQPVQGNSPRAPIRRTDVGAPVWLDALILSLGGLLIAMIIRRFELL
ncbi:Ubiquitin-conjugating enzyme E2 J1 [Podila minutissima]|uniref:Ubiquitin-conjugating enzyme E2 J1 n=1 Tax=Podila minutissima TaxID=64525 RepID=A0A9P5VRL6_9FUNG|nr:Ubiquitin-conjugating enzyme E2 J1 [Podila minutissima]